MINLSSTARIRRACAGGEFAFCLHVTRLVDRVRGRAFAAVIRPSPRQTDEADPHCDRDLVPNTMARCVRGMLGVGRAI
jgi:hypothetical protein